MGAEQPRENRDEILIQETVRRWKREAEIEFFPSSDLQITQFDHPASISSPATMSWEHSFEFAKKMQIETNAEVTLHTAWRNATSEGDVAKRVEQIQNAGLKSFFIAGDNIESGPITETTKALEIMRQQGLRLDRIGFPAYPYNVNDPEERGHGFIPNDVLKSSLFAKQEYAEKTGTEAYVVTQLQFYIKDIAPWVNQMRKDGFCLPIYINVMIPISFPKLIWYIKKCGLANAQRIINSFPDKATMALEFFKGYNPNPLLYQLAKEKVDIQGIVVTSTNRFAETEAFVNS